MLNIEDQMPRKIAISVIRAKERRELLSPSLTEMAEKEKNLKPIVPYQGRCFYGEDHPDYS